MTRKNEVITSTVSENSVTGNFCWNHSKVRIFIQNRLFSENYFFAKWVNFEKKNCQNQNFIFFSRECIFQKDNFFKFLGKFFFISQFWLRFCFSRFGNEFFEFLKLGLPVQVSIFSLFWKFSSGVCLFDVNRHKTKFFLCGKRNKFGIFWLKLGMKKWFKCVCVVTRTYSYSPKFVSDQNTHANTIPSSNHNRLQIDTFS